MGIEITERIRLAFIRPLIKDLPPLSLTSERPSREEIKDYLARNRNHIADQLAGPQVLAYKLLSELAKSNRMEKAVVGQDWMFGGRGKTVDRDGDWCVMTTAELTLTGGYGGGNTWFLARGAYMLARGLTYEEMEKTDPSDTSKNDNMADMARKLRCAVECSAQIEDDWSEPAWWMPDGKRVYDGKDFLDAIGNNMATSLLRRAAEGLD